MAKRCEIVALNPDARVGSWDDFEPFLPPDPKKHGLYAPIKDPEWRQKAIESLAEGNRNKTILSLLGSALRRGMSHEEAYVTYLPLATQAGLDAAEFDNIFRSATRYHPDSETNHKDISNPDRNPLGWPIHKFLSYDTSPPAWICEPFISPGDIMFMTSDAGVGKTWLLLSLCLAIATNDQWLGRFKCRHVPVLYCDFDNHKRGDAIRRRLLKLVAAMGLEAPYSEFANNSITILTRHDLPNAFNLYKKEGLDALKADILTVGYGLVIVDTFVSVHGCANENDAAQMGTAINNLRGLASDTDSAFLISHHSRKPGADTSDTESRVSYRGSTAIKGGADCMLELAADKNPGIIRVRHTKFRHVEQIADFPVSIKDTGDGGTEVRAEDDSQMAATKKEVVKGWLMFDLWKLDNLPLEAGGWLAQAKIIERAKKENVGSLNPVKDALHSLKTEGRMDQCKARDLGILGNSIYWRKSQVGGIFGSEPLPFEP